MLYLLHDFFFLFFLVITDLKGSSHVVHVHDLDFFFFFSLCYQVNDNNVGFLGFVHSIEGFVNCTEKRRARLEEFVGYGFERSN